MSIISELQRSILLNLYHSPKFKDLREYVSAIYYAQLDEFIVGVEKQKPVVFITGDNDHQGSYIFEEIINRIDENLLMFLVDSVASEDLKEDNILVAEIDCSVDGKADVIQNIIKFLDGRRAFLNIYNLDIASNDTLLWLSNWLPEVYGNENSNLLITLEAFSPGTHTLLLGLEDCDL